MPVTDLTDMLAHAHRHGYALGAFTVRDLASLSGVLAAAENSRAPVVVSPEATDAVSLEVLLPAVEAAANRARVPVAIQLAVAPDPDAVATAIRLGGNGLRINAAGDSFPRTVQQVQSLAATASACGLAAEAAPAADLVGTAAEASRFVEGTGIHSLRLALAADGNGSNAKGRPDYTRLKQINQALAMPLSVDAGNGLSEDQYRRLIRHGVAAIGYTINPAELAGERIRENGRSGSEPLAGVADAVTAKAEACMRMWGAAGRAAEVLAQCAPWQGAEQLLLCNFPETGEADTEAILQRGEHVLAGIPGVRTAAGATALTEDAPYRYAWRVRLCHPAALTGFEAHPDRAAFAAGRIHPEAQGCTGAQYRRLGDGSGPTGGGPAPSVPNAAPAGKGATRAPGTRRNPA
jgi:fructose-bisphosphate aldolase class II